VSENDALAEQFEAHRDHLRAVAYRMLGSSSEADDAVQEAWLRLSRSGPEGVQNLGGWLTTVVARVCLDMLRSRTSRREEPLSEQAPEELVSQAAGADPEHETVLADSVGLALLVVLDTLSPAERLAFVLHDMFAVPFGEIAPILGRSPAAAKQLASRARRRVQGAGPGADLDTGASRQREIVRAFLAASRDGDFDALLALLDLDALLRVDQTAAAMGGASEARGAVEVAGTFSGRARAVRLVLVNGVAGAVWSYRGEPQVVFAFTIRDGKITEIAMVADPGQLSQLDLMPA
jgi:RNA polymerase sigma-70 factor (ECF subfamily)